SIRLIIIFIFFFFFQAEDGIRDKLVTGVQTCALPILFGSFHYLNNTINGDLQNVLAMFNEEQSGINYPARFLGKASNPFMPDYIDVTPLQDNAAYPGRIHLTPAQRERVIHFRDLWQQAIPEVFAQFQAVGYSSLDYYDSNNQNTSQPIFI